MSDRVFEEATEILGPELVAQLRARAAQRLIDQPLSETQIALIAGLMTTETGPASNRPAA